jgi:hypothetical protein
VQEYTGGSSACGFAVHRFLHKEHQDYHRRRARQIRSSRPSSLSSTRQHVLPV